MLALLLGTILVGGQTGDTEDTVTIKTPSNVAEADEDRGASPNQRKKR